MIYSSVSIANTFMFLHFNKNTHIEMNISRLNMLCFLSHSIAFGQTKNNLIDELIIVGDYFPIYESLYRSFITLPDETIESYGQLFNYEKQKYFIPIMNEENREFCFVKNIHEQFFEMNNNSIEWLLTKEGSPYDLAYKNEMTFIAPDSLNLDFLTYSSQS